MNYKALMTLLCSTLLSLTTHSVFSADVPMEKQFVNPPASAKAHTYWFWMNGNISRKGITSDLEAMARVGIGGVLILNVSLPEIGRQFTPAGSASILSEEWYEMLHFAASEAARLGIDIGMNNCPGWSSSGGPWIKPKMGMQTLTIGEIQVKGGNSFNGALPKGEVKMDYYRDIAVLAFPTPTDPTRIADHQAKSFMGKGCEGLMPRAADVPVGAIIDVKKIIDLSGSCKDGVLKWDAPPGDWTILRIGHTCTGKINHPAQPAGTGLDCDKLSREALEAHFRGGIKPIADKLGPLVGKSLKYMHIDSYEVGVINWTPKMREEFKNRRGYDLLKFLPTVTGRIVGSSEQSERFLWDLRRTIGDLYADNYYGYFVDLCHKNGFQAAMEPYHGPFEVLQAGAKADLPMAEFWVAGNYHADQSVKTVSGIAHTHGKSIVPAEAFTAENVPGRWLQHPGSIKGLGDINWAKGINRFVLHCYAHQPWDDLTPGMTMGQYGSHFNRNNTWWEQSKPWFDYLKRGQSLLQSGCSVSDVLCFGGEESPNNGAPVNNLRNLGYDYDALGSDLILRLSVRDGRIYTPAGTSYRLLQVPGGEWMRPELARHLRSLVESGACIVGGKPKRSPSLSGYPACDQEVSEIGNQLWADGQGEKRFGKGRMFAGMSVEDALKAMNLKPDCRVIGSQKMLPFIHRKVDTSDLYFIANADAASYGSMIPPVFSGTLSFRAVGRVPEFWDAETGVMSEAPIWRIKGDQTEVEMEIKPQGSMFVVFRHETERKTSMVQSLSAPVSKLDVWKPKVEIESAFYGTDKLSEEMMEVGSALADQIKNGRLELKMTSWLAKKDPAPNKIKRFGVIYEINGKQKKVTVADHQFLSLPEKDADGTLKIVRAVYGVIPDDLEQLLAPAMIEVSDKIAGMMGKEGVKINVGSDLVGGKDLASAVRKKLDIRYKVDGVAKTKTLMDGEELRLPERSGAFDLPAAEMLVKEKATVLRSWENGDYSVGLSDGSKKTIAVKDLPQPLLVRGPWDLRFQEKRGAPEKISLPELVSLSTHPEPGVRYFSGQVTYQRRLNIPSEMLGKDRELYLDLGQVEVIAEVTLNGKQLGTLWKAPYRIDISSAMKAGENDLSIRVTNLWPNRLIGDEFIPSDVDSNGEFLTKWPEWLKDGKQPVNRKRITFVTWQHWKADSNLLASGLMGPVTLRPAVLAPIIW